MVEVSIFNIAGGPDSGTTIVDYRVDNFTSSSIWLVDDGWRVWQRLGENIELSFARATMQPGASVYGYFNPEVVKIDAHQHVIRHIELNWPLQLSRLWNPVSTATLPAGVYNLSISIGYGLTPTPPEPAQDESVETPVLQWQIKVRSQPVRLQIDAMPS